MYLLPHYNHQFLHLSLSSHNLCLSQVPQLSQSKSLILHSSVSTPVWHSKWAKEADESGSAQARGAVGGGGGGGLGRRAMGWPQNRCYRSQRGFSVSHNPHWEKACVSESEFMSALSGLLVDISEISLQQKTTCCSLHQWGQGVRVRVRVGSCITQLSHVYSVFVFFPFLYIMVLFFFFLLMSPTLSVSPPVCSQRLKDEIAEVTNEIESLGVSEER